MESIEILRRFIKDELVPEKASDDLDKDESLLENGILDSLSIMKLIAFIEERFKLKISDEELIPENFETLSALAKLISEKQ